MGSDHAYRPLPSDKADLIAKIFAERSLR